MLLYISVKWWIGNSLYDWYIEIYSLSIAISKRPLHASRTTFYKSRTIHSTVSRQYFLLPIVFLFLQLLHTYGLLIELCYSRGRSGAARSHCIAADACVILYPERCKNTVVNSVLSHDKGASTLTSIDWLVTGLATTGRLGMSMVSRCSMNHNNNNSPTTTINTK